MRSRPRLGMSLLEVVFAVAILAAAVLSFFQVFSQGMTFTRDIRDYAVLINLGEKLMHSYIVQINNTPADSPISFFETDVTADVKNKEKNPSLEALTKLKTFATVRPSLLCDNNGYEIVIKFEWESAGRAKSFSLATMKAVRE